MVRPQTIEVGGGSVNHPRTSDPPGRAQSEIVDVGAAEGGRDGPDSDPATRGGASAMTGPHGVERDVDRIAEPGEDRRDRGGAEQPAGRRPARQLTVAVAATVLVAVVLTVGLTLGLSRLWAAEAPIG